MTLPPDPGRVSESHNGAPQDQNMGRTLQEMVEECNRLRSELASVQKERDQYLKSIKYLTIKEIEFDEEVALALAKTQEPFSEFVARLAKSVGVEDAK